MVDNVNDFQLRYVGARFNGGRLPVEALADLPAFRDLIVAFAKANWKREFSDRKRLPKGFDQSLSFDLTRIDEGSAIPNLNWNRASAQQYLPEMVDQLDHIVGAAFEQVVSLIDGVDRVGGSAALSAQQVRALNKLGASLRDDERIEFLNTLGSDGNVIYIDRDRRRRLITRVRNTYQTRAEGLGVLVQARAEKDRNEGHIVIATGDFGEITIPINPEIVREEYAANLGSRISYDLQLDLDHKDLFKGVVEIFDLSLVDEEVTGELQRCAERINFFATLQPGWNEGSGDRISNGVVTSALGFVNKYSAISRLFKIYPIESGGISFEFEYDGWDFTVEFAADGHVEMYGTEIDGDNEMEPVEFLSASHEFFHEFDNRLGNA